MSDKRAGCLEIAPRRGQFQQGLLGTVLLKASEPDHTGGLTVLVWGLRIPACDLASASETPPRIFQPAQQIHNMADSLI